MFKGKESYLQNKILQICLKNITFYNERKCIILKGTYNDLFVNGPKPVWRGHLQTEKCTFPGWIKWAKSGTLILTKHLIVSQVWI